MLRCTHPQALPLLTTVSSASNPQLSTLVAVNSIAAMRADLGGLVNPNNTFVTAANAFFLIKGAPR
jgi:hypothetical protein